MEATVDNINSMSNPKPQVIYRCKKCRRMVASEEHIVSHVRGEGQKCFKWKRRSGESDVDPPECSSIFVEPMKWMQAARRQASMHGLQSTIGFLQLGWYAVQLWNMD